MKIMLGSKVYLTWRETQGANPFNRTSVEYEATALPVDLRL